MTTQLGTTIASAIAALAVFVAAIVRLAWKFDAVNASLTARIDALGADLRADLGGRINAQTAHIDAQTSRIDELLVRSHTHDHTSA